MAASSSKGTPPTRLRLVENGKVFYPASMRDYEITRSILRTPTVLVNMDHVDMLIARAKANSLRPTAVKFSVLEKKALQAFEETSGVELTVRESPKETSGSQVISATFIAKKSETRQVKKALKALRAFYHSNLHTIEVKARKQSGGFKITLTPIRDSKKVPDWDSKEYEEASLTRLVAFQQKNKTAEEHLTEWKARLNQTLGPVRVRTLGSNVK